MNARMTKTFLLGMVLVCFSAFSMFADSATVVSLQGKVEVSRGGKWVELSAKSKVSEGEVISTGFKSQAVIQYQGAMLQLGP
ncbi:MAG: iron dicitrate transport regulator FecR, partial [Treponema sp.]|nr:iron dicitrate transport regulator FecR [Treponema sp.]